MSIRYMYTYVLTERGIMELQNKMLRQDGKMEEGIKNNLTFGGAIKKYGWNSIEHIIVANGLTEEEAYWLEGELTREWKSSNPDKSYNIDYGLLPSEETKKKMSEIRKKSVLCLTTKRIFQSIEDGSKCYKIKSTSNITECCKGKRKSAGKYQGKKLVWRYLLWNHNKRFRIKGE